MKMDQGQRRRCCELEELDSETLAEMVVELEAKVFAQSSETEEDRKAAAIEAVWKERQDALRRRLCGIKWLDGVRGRSRTGVTTFAGGVPDHLGHPDSVLSILVSYTLPQPTSPTGMPLDELVLLPVPRRTKSSAK